MKLIFSISIFLLTFQNLAGQELNVGSGFYFYKQKLERVNIPGTYDTISHTALNAQSINLSVTFKQNNFFGSISYYNYHLVMNLNGIYTSGSGSGHGGSSSSYTTYSVDSKISYHSFLISAGIVAFKNKKINLMPSIALGAEKNYSIKYKTNTAYTDWSSVLWTTPPQFSSGQYTHEASDFIDIATDHAILKVFNLKLRFNFNKYFCVDLDGGYKQNTAPKFKIAYEYQEAHEWYAGITLNYRLHFKTKAKKLIETLE